VNLAGLFAGNYNKKTGLARLRGKKQRGLSSWVENKVIILL
jgi:hypothetical protein